MAQAAPQHLPSGHTTGFSFLFVLIFGLYMLLGMHYFQPNLGGAGLQLPTNAIGWIFITLMIALGLWHIATTSTLRYNRFNLVLLLGGAMMTLPLCWASGITAPLSYARLLGLWGGILFFVSLQQMRFNPQQKRTLLYLILTAVLIESLFSLYQYFLLQSGNIFGYNTVINRPYGIFQQPNVAASFLTTGVALSLYLLSTESRQSAKWLCLVTLFVAVIPVVILQSRTGYLSLVIAPMLMLPWAWHRCYKAQRLPELLAWLALYAVSMLLGSLTLEQADSVARAAAEMTNPGARVPIYLHSLEMFLEKPWLGWGYGSFEVSYLHSYTNALAYGHALPGSAPNLDHPHNELLFWAVEGGIIPLAGIAIMAAGFLHGVFKHNSGFKSIALVGLLFPILLHTQTEYPFYQSVIHWVIFITLIWLQCGDIECREISVRASFLVKFLALLIPLLTALYMLTTLHTTYLMVKYEQSNPKDLRPLTHVINPESFMVRFDNAVNSFRLQTALIKNDRNEMKHYIHWAQYVSETTPRATVYYNWIRALWQLGQQQQARNLLAKAKVLYPGENILQQMVLTNATKANASDTSDNATPVSQPSPSIKTPVRPEPKQPVMSSPIDIKTYG
ncbi:ligase [Shewanella sp. NFH-SH190041]|uniref:PglL family O-oligosaccharyltransferase n=1 Tax=Shewanella sp. NFH-SH190041 TaxID=2950245 RepID=UPI0021C3D9BD|nr:PglL family O-oligosaccharyltransferase [Shewanella sp. NFH-SH190041]BDM62675.1 ligase [Shewanella sp. NFH-SH190041]